MRPLYINGRFCAGVLNGVHRVAGELVEQLDRQLGLLAPADRPEVTLLVPRRRRATPQLEHIRIREQGEHTGQLWEQLALPWIARDGVLLSLCNLGPVLHPQQVLMVHDAQFQFRDCGYTRRQRRGYRTLIPLIARSARLVLTVSEYSRQILDLTRVADAGKTRVIHNGADHLLRVEPRDELIAELGLQRGQFVLHFASTKPYKNTRVVLQAFRDPRLAGLRLVLVGDPPERLRDHGLDIDDGVTYVPKVDDRQLAALYQAALCVAFPSRTEGFGLPPIEAMALGCPAVVAPAGAIPEVCGDAAIYAGTDQPGEWAEAFRTLREEAERRDAKIDAGRARARRCTWALAGRRLLDLLLPLLQAR